jgi:hypothetical protein
MWSGSQQVFGTANADVRLQGGYTCDHDGRALDKACKLSQCVAELQCASGWRRRGRRSFARRKMWSEGRSGGGA